MLSTETRELRSRVFSFDGFKETGIFLFVFYHPIFQQGLHLGEFPKIDYVN